MPTILNLRLIPLRNGTLNEENAPAQGWFMHLLDAADQKWGDTLHTPNQMRLYKPSPLYILGEGYVWHRRLSREIQQGSEYHLRLAILDDARAAWLCGVLPEIELPKLGHVPVRLASFPVFSSTTSLDDSPRSSVFREVEHCSWADLVKTPPTTSVQLIFDTPTAFISNDDVIPLAEPRRLWESWQRLWETFAPETLVKEVKAVNIMEHLPLIRGYTLATETTTIKHGIFVGFVGQMDLVWRKGTPESVRQTMGMLARYATFCGTGAKTAQGMGQTQTHLF
jgi:CRISPR-associated endoribonuclease Cas6